VNDCKGALSLNGIFGSDDASTYGPALGDVNGDGMTGIVSAESLAVNRIFYQKRP
jgi:hypothetical protein